MAKTMTKHLSKAPLYKMKIFQLWHFWVQIEEFIQNQMKKTFVIQNSLILVNMTQVLILEI